MTSTPETRIAEALAEHAANGCGTCTCGWDAPDPDEAEKFEIQHGRHQLAVIAALPDIAVVELPDHSPVVGNGFTSWESGAVRAQAGSGRVRCHSEGGLMHSGDARRMAAELLAAAHWADRKGRDYSYAHTAAGGGS